MGALPPKPQQATMGKFQHGPVILVFLLLILHVVCSQISALVLLILTGRYRFGVVDLGKNVHVLNVLIIVLIAVHKGVTMDKAAWSGSEPS